MVVVCVGDRLRQRWCVASGSSNSYDMENEAVGGAVADERSSWMVICLSLIARRRTCVRRACRISRSGVIKAGKAVSQGVRWPLIWICVDGHAEAGDNARSPRSRGIGLTND
jgi:hypothetical protein